jgi:hypothetical protein
MLLDELGPEFRELVDLKLKAAAPPVEGAPELSAEVGLHAPQRGRYARAERVCAALETKGLVGTLDDASSDDFRGEALAAWGFFNRANRAYADVVFFTGRSGERTLFGLGGSAYHTMEREAPRLQQYSNSGIRQLMGFLKEQSELRRAQDETQWIAPAAWDGEAFQADYDNVFVPEHVEFVAERLLDSKDDPAHQTYGLRVIIGTPIYVARSGRATSRRELSDYNAARDMRELEGYQQYRFGPRGSRWGPAEPGAAIMPPVEDPARAEER